jgi:hypothetical protein
MLLRFWSKVDVGGPDDCWPWTKSKRLGGYGQFMLAPQTPRIASRMAYVFNHATPIPDGLVVRHKCDNPPCCNPQHLELGTHGENMQDRVERNPEASRKHRGRIGSIARQSRMNLDMAFAMRVDLATGMLGVTAAEKYGVSPSHVARIRRGDVWPGH